MEPPDNVPLPMPGPPPDAAPRQIPGPPSDASPRPMPGPPEPDTELVLLVNNPPPVNNVNKYVNFDVKTLKIIIRNHTQLKESRSHMDRGLTILREERVLLDRVLYKNQNRFRNDRGFKALRILQKSVDKLLERFPSNVLSNMSSMMPLGIPNSSSGAPSSLLLPPAAIAQNTALKLWAAHALLERVEYCCRSAGVYAQQRISLGHFWGVGAYQLAIVSRLWVLTGDVIKHLVQIVGNVRSIAENLPEPRLYTEEILTKIYSILPRGKEAESRGKKSVTQEKELLERQSLPINFNMEIGVKLKREEFAKQIQAARQAVQAVEDLEESQQKKQKEEKSPNHMKKKIDAPVLIETQKRSLNYQPDLTFLSDLHGLQDLQTFLETETKRRKADKKASLTRKLSQDEWKELKKLLISSFNKKLPNKSIKLCRKMITESLLPT